MPNPGGYAVDRGQAVAVVQDQAQQRSDLWWPVMRAERVSPTASPAFTAWLDSLFQAYYRRRPVNATFVGVHAYDDRLPDLSAAGSADSAAEAAQLLARLEALPREPLSAAEAI